MVMFSVIFLIRGYQKQYSYNLLASIPHRHWTAPLSNALSTTCWPQSPTDTRQLHSPPDSREASCLCEDIKSTKRLTQFWIWKRKCNRNPQPTGLPLCQPRNLPSSTAIPRHDKEPALISAGPARQYHLVTAHTTIG